MTSAKRSWTWRQACDNPPQSHPVMKRVWILIAKQFHLQNIPMGLGLSFHLLSFPVTTNLSIILTTILTTTFTWSRTPPCSATPHCQKFRRQRPACPSPAPAGRWSPRSSWSAPCNCRIAKLYNCMIAKWYNCIFVVYYIRLADHLRVIANQQQWKRTYLSLKFAGPLITIINNFVLAQSTWSSFGDPMAKFLPPFFVDVWWASPDFD